MWMLELSMEATEVEVVAPATASSSLGGLVVAS